MFANYLKTCLRNLRRYKTYSSINVLGLSLGLCAALLLSLYLYDEFTFDRYHDKSDRTYRLLLEFTEPGQATRTFDTVTGGLAPALQSELVGVDEITQLYMLGRTDLTYEENEYYEPFLVADASLFEVFDFRFLRGDPLSALQTPGGAVITEQTARRYFGNEDPIGKVLESQRGDVQITGIIAAPPPNSHLQFNVLFAAPEFAARKEGNWEEFDATSYLVLSESVDAAAIEARIPEVLRANLPPDIEPLVNVRLQGLTDIHFGSAEVQSSVSANSGSLGTVLTLAAIAFFILFIACVNYINLATARAVSRATEIGVRKVVGAQRRQLVRQFLGESLLLTGMAFVLALALVQLGLPVFNSFADKALTLSSLFGSQLAFTVVGFALLVGIAAGSYPAFYLANTDVIKALSAEHKGGRNSLSVRQALVVAQFALSVILLVATFVAMRQMDYINARSLGFDPRNIVVMDINSGASREGFQAIKNEFMRHPNVLSVSVSSRVPGEWKNIIELNALSPGRDINQAIRTSFMGIDQDFLSTFAIELVAGRNYSGAAGDDNSILINQRLARQLGWEEPVGRQLQLASGNERTEAFTVIGVVADYNFRSLHEPIGPLILGPRINPIQSIDYFSARVRGTDLAATLQHLETAQASYDPDTPFEYNLLEDQIANLYQSDTLTTRLFGIAAAIAVFIACLGLYGLSTFATLQRAKELSIRKILGANIRQIVSLLSVDLIKLIVLANFLAWPIVFYLMNRWLAGFAYHTSLGIDSFLVAALLLILLSIGTIGGHAVRLALKNPVESIRYE